MHRLYAVDNALATQVTGMRGVYLGNAMDSCCQVDGIEALLEICIQSQDLSSRGGAHNEAGDLAWVWHCRVCRPVGSCFWLRKWPPVSFLLLPALSDCTCVCICGFGMAAKPAAGLMWRSTASDAAFLVVAVLAGSPLSCVCTGRGALLMLPVAFVSCFSCSSARGSASLVPTM